jgi:hypothetical protein
MMSAQSVDFETLLTRVNALEKQSRKVRLIGSLSFLCVLITLSLVVSYLVFRRTIKAQEFVVKDSQGNVRGTLGLNGLTVKGSDGTSQIRLFASGKSEGLLMTDADGQVRIYLNSMPDVKTTMLSLSAEGGSVDIKVSPIGREVNLQDELGGSQVTLESAKYGPSLTLGHMGTKEQGIITSNGIGFWDREGKVIYAAGRK